MLYVIVRYACSMTNLKRKANMLLMELESLKECKPGVNTIGMYQLLEEVLKDATHLAREAIQELPAAMPANLTDRLNYIRAHSAKALARGKAASVKSRATMLRSQEIMSRQAHNLSCAE